MLAEEADQQIHDQVWRLDPSDRQLALETEARLRDVIGTQDVQEALPQQIKRLEHLRETLVVLAIYLARTHGRLAWFLSGALELMGGIGVGLRDGAESVDAVDGQVVDGSLTASSGTAAALSGRSRKTVRAPPDPVHRRMIRNSAGLMGSRDRWDARPVRCTAVPDVDSPRCSKRARGPFATGGCRSPCATGWSRVQRDSS
ncbi:hypothetical protein [Streptomyces sp. NRRL B-24085]|uniref:hypothetical protein n=1 Tax=Streptomyces sp. NRRL B-24085 TaxID=1709476 RepID=UPI0015C50740|nr:hypothetical protein [Streptomyces sp. NRRL B-24085]